ncbi:low molecular weight protein-tyrosine-phosphatase [Caballeronia insecticola]|uniref:protein-tyrosine-phosphatase n=1 Tax=Caballeronia insecticola TaxID=758793 RepID=R4WTW2_9BURK|nr:low molecular weight protein-tyrosine-phosphatase [Caballeronia insecticola]BAN28019.1 protein tyrosine phosphatase [Caballeronia insecticola]
MFGSVLIVCHANICRSPAAEMLFRAHLDKRGARPIEFRSAGLYAQEGEDIDPTMQRLLAEQGLEASGHRSRRLDRRMARDADLILVPERKQIDAIARLAPTTRGKVHLLGKWEDSEVADPYGGHEAAYRESFGLIERLVLGWLNKIC